MLRTLAWDLKETVKAMHATLGGLRQQRAHLGPGRQNNKGNILPTLTVSGAPRSCSGPSCRTTPRCLLQASLHPCPQKTTYTTIASHQRASLGGVGFYYRTPSCCGRLFVTKVPMSQDGERGLTLRELHHSIFKDRHLALDTVPVWWFGPRNVLNGVPKK